MKNTLLQQNKLSNAKGVKTPTQTHEIGRVVDVIYNDSHEEYDRRGGLRSLGGVFYIPLGLGSATQNKKEC